MESSLMALEMLNNVLRFGALVFYTSPTVVLRMATADVGTMLQGEQLALYNQYTKEYEENERKRKERDNKHNSYTGQKRFAGTCHSCGKVGHRMSECHNKENKKPSKWIEAAAPVIKSDGETSALSTVADTGSRAQTIYDSSKLYDSNFSGPKSLLEHTSDITPNCDNICDTPEVCPQIDTMININCTTSPGDKDDNIIVDNDMSDESFVQYIDNHIADLISRGYKPLKRNIHSAEAYDFYKNILGADQKVLDLLKFGYVPKFVKKPPSAIDLPNNKNARSQLAFVKEQTDEWLRKGIIVQTVAKPKFVNPISVAVKKNSATGTSKLRMCLDLSRSLNGLLQDETCTMEDIHNVTPRYVKYYKIKVNRFSRILVFKFHQILVLVPNNFCLIVASSIAILSDT